MSQKNHPRFEDRYDLRNRLGEGSFAKVYACTKKDEGSSALAVKVFDRTTQRGLRREFRGEVQLLRSVTPSEYCVQMLDSFESRKFCHIVMEKCGMSVQQAVIRYNSREVNELDLAHLFKCMLTAVQHLHECGIVHRDIKPANLLLAEGSSPSLSSRPLVKICDLGLASKLPARGGLTEICGTAPYMAPEMLLASRKKKPYDQAVDIWSCGVTAYLMLLGSYPYKDKCNDPVAVKEAIREGKTRPMFESRPGFAQPSQAAIHMIGSLLRREPELRPDAVRALNSEYIKQLSGPAQAPLSLPSFGPTLTLVHDLTRDEPAAETPAVGPHLADSDKEGLSDSTSCGSSSDNPDNTDEGCTRTCICETVENIPKLTKL
jgi:serine/threonine protein kinase